MREIKFRCWDKTARKMRQVIEIVFNAGMYYDTNDNTVKLIWVKGHDIINNKDIALEREHKNEYILMQYTGLKDKNGKEVYLGDILEYTFTDYKGKKLWKERYIIKENISGWEMRNITKPRGHRSLSLVKNYKIIGNIYENPELLEDK